MRNQRLQIDDARRNHADRLGIDVVVAVLEAQVDFFGGHVHEGDVLEVSADADYEDGALGAGRLRMLALDGG